MREALEEDPSPIQLRPSVDYIRFTCAQYDVLGWPSHRWVETETTPPFAPLQKACRGM